jgi:hypothetical protein
MSEPTVTKYAVEIVAYEGGAVVKHMPCYSYRDAENVERGANINLNHEGYFTRIVTSDGREVQESESANVGTD